MPRLTVPEGWVPCAYFYPASRLAMELQTNRLARTNVRIALRQLMALGHPSRALPEWTAAFDALNSEGDEEEAAKQARTLSCKDSKLDSDFCRF